MKRGCVFILIENIVISYDNNYVNDVCIFNMIILEYCFNIPVGSESRRDCMLILIEYTVISHNNKNVNYVCSFTIFMMTFFYHSSMDQKNQERLCDNSNIKYN